MEPLLGSQVRSQLSTHARSTRHRINSMRIATVIYDRSTWDAYLGPSIAGLSESVPVLAVNNAQNSVSTNIAQIYNTLLSIDGPDITAFMHPDVTFGSDFAREVQDSISLLQERRWGALGIVGRSDGGDYVWGSGVDVPTEVSTLDSCCLITRASFGIRFDSSRFDEFHCFVEDYCLQVRNAGLEVLVLPIDVQHHSATLSHRGKAWGAYRRYRKRLDRKWRKRFPSIMTT